MMRMQTKRINSIKFALVGPDEIRRMSVMKVTRADTYDDRGYPVEGGPMDLRLGVVEPGLRCKTCGGKQGECPGHFGHIELAMPVIHVGYVKVIETLLQSTCPYCGRIKLKDEEILLFKQKMKSMEKLGIPKPQIIEAISKEVKAHASQVRICPHCGRPIKRKVVYDSPYFFYEIDWEIAGRGREELHRHGKKLTPKDIRERLMNIPDDDLVLLGIDPSTTRPEYMILTVLPVPPITVRPTITLETGERSEDDLTHKLVDVIRSNLKLQKSRDEGAPQLIIEEQWDLLQYHVATLFNNQLPHIPPARHRSGKELKTLVQRLKGKEGRFRGSLSGKRVNFSARTVISPDPFISLNEVGVPEFVARELTIPIAVREENIEFLRELVRRGPKPESPDGKYVPGANYVIQRPQGWRIKITEKNKETLAEQLEVGWIVERHMMDGDVVIFNRQPSLHRMSMMAHFVRVVPDRTFKLQLATCTPYNADFDGDEMNLHALQSEEARAEAKILMAVEKHILSPRFGGPIIGGIHDHISGLFLLTHGERLIPKEVAMHILSYVDVDELPEPVVRDGKVYYRGKDLFSLILPKGLNMEFPAKICPNEEECRRNEELDGWVVIRNGRLIKGTIDENAVGAFKGRIIERIARLYGLDEAKRFIDRMTRLAVGTITYLGFTTGIDDNDLPKEALRKIRKVISEAVRKVDELVEAYRNGTLEPLPGKSLEDTLEQKIMQTLSKARDQAGEIAGKHLGFTRSTVVMAKSGARASMLNLTQMTAALGQQSVRGQRLHRGYYQRPLPHFKRGDLGAFARGFVASSYKKGLEPVEYFFHSMGGREGLVDTAVRTSKSGYMQRRLINALEDLKVLEDGSVRDPTGRIIQVRYGEDGIDPTRSYRGKPIDVEAILSREDMLGGGE